MAHEILSAEVVNEGTPETNKGQSPRIVGFVAMPKEVKEVYYLARNSDQLIIPKIADPMDSTKVNH